MQITVDSERGQELGFTSEWFTADSYLWEEPTRIMISLIQGRTPGVFRMLVRKIHEQGKDVAVPTPLGRMRNIVEKCGYRFLREVDEASGEECEVWTCSAACNGGMA
jgi:hypothetical protein